MWVLTPAIQITLYRSSVKCLTIRNDGFLICWMGMRNPSLRDFVRVSCGLKIMHYTNTNFSSYLDLTIFYIGGLFCSFVWHKEIQTGLINSEWSYLYMSSQKTHPLCCLILRKHFSINNCCWNKGPSNSWNCNHIRQACPPKRCHC